MFMFSISLISIYLLFYLTHARAHAHTHVCTNAGTRVTTHAGRQERTHAHIHTYTHTNTKYKLTMPQLVVVATTLATTVAR